MEGHSSCEDKTKTCMNKLMGELGSVRVIDNKGKEKVSVRVINDKR